MRPETPRCFGVERLDAADLGILGGDARGQILGA